MYIRFGPKMFGFFLCRVHVEFSRAEMCSAIQNISKIMDNIDMLLLQES